jgi:sigma-E factor negative regulatory protein RseB
MPDRPVRLIAARALLTALMLPAALLLTTPSPAADKQTTERKDTTEQDARAWLERMNRAVRELDYEGYFVYSHGDALDAMHIVHVNRDGHERERLISLNGAAREVLRDDKAVTCLLPRRDRIKVSRRPIGRSFSPLLPVETDALAKNYRFSIGPGQRVAGRQAVTIDIQPKDDLRYGYLFSLDRNNALPLRSVMRDVEGRTLSQILFTNLRIGAEVAGVEVASVPDEISDSKASSEALERVRLQAPCCQFSELPPGFALSMHRHRVIDNEQEAEHFVFSDGLTSVSVYVEPYQAGKGLSGTVNMGSVNLLGIHLAPFQVTLVGEVPVQTLQQFAEHISVAQK